MSLGIIFGVVSVVLAQYYLHGNQRDTLPLLRTWVAAGNGQSEAPFSEAGRGTLVVQDFMTTQKMPEIGRRAYEPSLPPNPAGSDPTGDGQTS